MPQAPGREHGRQAGVAADGHDDRAAAARAAAPIAGPSPRPASAHERAEVAPVEPRAAARRRRGTCAGTASPAAARLDAALGADVVDRRRVVPGGDERLGDRQRRQHVPGRAAAGDDGERRRCRASIDASASPSRGPAGDVEQQPGRHHRDEQRRAAGREERQRQPGDRHQPGDAADVDRRPARRTRSVIPPASSMPEAVGRGERGLDAEPRRAA